MSTSPLRIVLNIAGFLLLWEILILIFEPPNWMLPAPSTVLVELASDPYLYLTNSWDTLVTTLAGFFLALVVGTLLAILIVEVPLIDNTLCTFLVSFNSVPKIAMAPLFVIWLGMGPQSRISVSFLIAFFPIVIDTILGLRSTDPDAVGLFRAFHGSAFQTLIKLRLPNALPYIFSGMKVAVSFALVGAIAGEFIASQSGLGSIILAAQGMFMTERVFAAIILLGVLGTALFYIVDVAERLLCPWHVFHRKQDDQMIVRG
jgi:NitT/TauT family transport system permease protein